MGRPTSSDTGLALLPYLDSVERGNIIVDALEAGDDLDGLAEAIHALGPADSVLATLDALAQARRRSRPDLEKKVFALDAAVRRLEETEYG